MLLRVSGAGVWVPRFPVPGIARNVAFYRNGALLESFHASNAVIRRLNPEMILPGHGPAKSHGGKEDEGGPAHHRSLPPVANRQFETAWKKHAPAPDKG